MKVKWLIFGTLLIIHFLVLEITEIFDIYKKNKNRHFFLFKYLHPKKCPKTLQCSISISNKIIITSMPKKISTSLTLKFHLFSSVLNETLAWLNFKKEFKNRYLCNFSSTLFHAKLLITFHSRFPCNDIWRWEIKSIEDSYLRKIYVF